MYSFIYLFNNLFIHFFIYLFIYISIRLLLIVCFVFHLVTQEKGYCGNGTANPPSPQKNKITSLK